MMKVHGTRYCTIAAWLAGGLIARTGVADAPRLVHFQGRLSTSAGANLTDPVNLRLRLYPHPTDPTPVLFDESHTNLALVNGLFSVFIGSQTGGGVPDAAATGADVFLGVSVDGAAELSPRTRVATTPFALFSNSGGLLPPRMTTAQRNAIAGPAIGLQVFNTDTNCMNMWIGATWKQSCFECDFPSPTTGNNGPICEGQTLNLTSTSIPGATYQWVGPNGFVSAQQNPSIGNATPSASGPYSVTATVAGCAGNPVTTLATVDEQPAPPTVINNGPLCAGQTLELTSSAVAGGAYQWSGPNGFSSNQQNPLIVNATAAATGTYTLVVTRGACTAVPIQTSAVVNSIPAAPASISGPASPCFNSSNNQYTAANVPEATNYAWTVPPGSTIAGGQGTAFLTVNFGALDGDITVTASNACGASPATTLFVDLQGSSGSQTFAYNGGVQDFTVPFCVTSLTIEAWGAEGGSGSAGAGGRGARMRGVITVAPGATLRVLAGGKGQNGTRQGGGGGGTFVWDPNNTSLPLIAAGGGGGGGYSLGAGMDGVTTENGTNGRGCPSGGGTGGNGGTSVSGSSGYAPGGAGWLSDGTNGVWTGCVAVGTGGRTPLSGGQGGAWGGSDNAQSGNGGFGGGGGTQGMCCCGSGGGGGGYSGGGGSGNACSAGRGQGGNGGGGDGSYNAGTNQDNSAGARTGDGEVTFSW